MSTHVDDVDSADCFEGSLGRDLLLTERSIIDDMISDVFGFNAIQIGFSDYDFLNNSRIPNKHTLSDSLTADIFGCPHKNPIKSCSVDLVVMPHGLEFSSNPHSVVREVERILLPGGVLVLSAFNPLSFWGLRHIIKRYTSSGKHVSPELLSLWRVKDWLKLLSIDIEAGRWGYYRLPLAREDWRKRFQFMESAGDRWWPIFGGLFFLKAVKKVRGMRITLDRWPTYNPVHQAIRSTQKDAAESLKSRRYTV